MDAHDSWLHSQVPLTDVNSSWSMAWTHSWPFKEDVKDGACIVAPDWDGCIKGSGGQREGEFRSSVLRNGDIIFKNPFFYCI